MFSDPFSVTYDGSAKSLPRTEVAKAYSRYNTADREFEILIANNLQKPQDGIATVSFRLTRRIPDPTSGDAFDAYRDIRNSFALSFSFDALTRAEASVDIPRLRTAVLATVDSTLQSRLISGER